MKVSWLWDRNISQKMLKDMLSDEEHPRFIEMAALVFSRRNNPKEVFSQYVDPKRFVCNWAKIKRQMRKNQWNDPRIIFWDFIYKEVIKDFKKQGIPVVLRKSQAPISEWCQSFGEKLKGTRMQSGLTQKEFSKRLGVSQQLVSRIESGRENISILTLEKFVKGLKKKLLLKIV